MTDDDEQKRHKSGLGFIRVEMWEEGDIPSTDDPVESVLFPVNGGERYAMDGDTVTFEEQFQEFTSRHISGECDCLGGNSPDDDGSLHTDDGESVQDGDVDD